MSDGPEHLGVKKKRTDLSCAEEAFHKDLTTTVERLEAMLWKLEAELWKVEVEDGSGPPSHSSQRCT